MATNLYVIMTTNNEDFMEQWKAQTKTQKRVSLINEALDFVNTQAYKDFGLEQSAFSKEVSKLILIAKDCLKNEKEE